VTVRSERKGRDRVSLDEWLSQAFEWVSENAQATLLVLGGVIVVAGAIAGVYEWNVSKEESAQAALAQVNLELDRAFSPGQEPANPETARKLRETALADFDEVARDHQGTFGATLAALRAGEMEIELQRFPAAEERLAKIGESDTDPLLRAIALRLRGYALERLGRTEEAATAYAAAASISDYPGRTGTYLQAGDAYARVDLIQKAVETYEKLAAIDPVFAEQAGVVDRLEALRAQLAGAPAKAAAGAAAAPANAVPAPPQTPPAP
jgi:tetratricopeptide (TPR) repeat protein